MSYKILEKACSEIFSGRLDQAKDTVSSGYPFVSVENTGRQYSELQKTQIFLRDGFVDRYSGDKLVFPPVLRILSSLMPEEFPFHKNWKMSECHSAYWELFPTVDHVIPVSRGGADDDSNWVCTSQLRNSAKSNWLLVDLGWELHPAGALSEWDGQIHWFMNYVKLNPDTLKDRYIDQWFKAAKKAL